MKHLRILPASVLLLAGALSGFARAGSIDAAIDLYHRGKFEEAARLLAGWKAADPKDAQVRFWLGKTRLKQRLWDEAVRELERAVALDPQSGVMHLWLGRAYGEKASRAFFLAAPGLAAKTRQQFEAAVKLAPDDIDNRFDLLEYYAEAPGILGGGREKAEAQAAAIAGLSARIGFSARARLHILDRRWDQARQKLEQATQKFPEDPGGYLDLAEFLLQRRDFPEAEKNARKAVSLEGTLPRARMLLAAAEVELRQNLEQAAGTLRELASGPLADGDPAFDEVYYWLGRALLARGLRDEARKALQMSLEFNPDHGQAKAVLAQIRSSL